MSVSLNASVFLFALYYRLSASVCLFALYYRLSASVCLFAMYYRLSSSVCLFEFTVQKVLYQHVLPTLLEECKQCDSVIYALPTLLTVIDFATRDDYCDNILTEFCAILTMPKPVQVTNSQLGYCLVEAYMVGGGGRWRRRLCTLYLLACQVRVTVGDSGRYRCVCVTSFEN